MAILFAGAAGVIEASAHQGVPVATFGVQLGSELEWTAVGVGSRTGAVSGAAATDSVAIVALTEDGGLWSRLSASYTGLWRQPVGCTDFLNCHWNYRASGQRTTTWSPWVSYGAAAGTFRSEVRPLVLADRSGTLHAFVSRHRPTPAIVYMTRRPGETRFTLTAIWTGPDAPRSFSGVVMGGEDGIGESSILMVANYADTRFRAFRIGLSPLVPATELTVLGGAPQISESPAAAAGFGKGHQQGAVLYKQAGTWRARHLHLATTGALVVDAEQSLSHIRATSAPQLVWLPGQYVLLTYQDTAGHLRGSVGGLLASSLVLLSGTAFTPEPVAPGGYRMFWHYSDVMVVAQTAGGDVRMYRFDPESVPANRFRPLGPAIPAPSLPLSSVTPVIVDQEVYALAGDESGAFLWMNLERRVTRDLLADWDVYPLASPNMNGLSAESVASYSTLGQAFRAVGPRYRQLFRNAPPACHPNGWTTPLLCANYAISYDDFGLVPTSDGTERWTSLADVRTALADNRDNDAPVDEWPLHWLKAFHSFMLLKTHIKHTRSVYHEMGHAVDYHVINGDWVPAERDRLRAGYAAAFEDRDGAEPGGRRGRGYVTDYAESNAREDFAECFSYYRFAGQRFRDLAASDAAAGDDRLQRKYDYVRDLIFFGAEFSDLGTLSYGSAPRALRRFVHPDGDVTLAFTVDGEEEALDDGYMPAWFQGYVLPASRPGTVPLKLWRKASPRDEFLTGTAAGEAAARAAGYTLVRVEGHAYGAAQSGARPLNLYRSPSGEEFQNLADPNDIAAVVASGYTRVRTEAWILETPY
jgi:hypothetical protein